MELQEIIQALKEGKTVHFKSTHYTVVLQDGVPCLYNRGWRLENLRDSYLEDCFIKGE